MIKEYIKSYKDFPVKGIDFKCIASLCSNEKGFRKANNYLYDKLLSVGPVDKIIGIDARGFIFASILSYKFNKPLILARKAGKLPGNCISKEFKLEYGTSIIEIQNESIYEKERVIIIDDLMATGGTVQAVVDIVKDIKAIPVAVGCVIDLSFLEGSKKIKEQGINFYAATNY